MSVGEVQQVPQSAASPVPPFIADAVFQHHVVGADGSQDGVDLLWRPLRIHLVHLLTQTAGFTSRRARLLPASSKTQPTNVLLQKRCEGLCECVCVCAHHENTPVSYANTQIC